MLRIKRVPTVVSNYQKEEGEEASRQSTGGCGRNCLNNCCLPGIFIYFVAPFVLLLLCNYIKLNYSYTDCGIRYRKLGSKLPLYAFKKETKVADGKELAAEEIKQQEPPVAFLESLVLGEVPYLLIFLNIF